MLCSSASYSYTNYGGKICHLSGEELLCTHNRSLQARLKPEAGSGRLHFERSEWDTPGHMIRDLVRPNKKGVSKVLEMGLVITGPASLIDPGEFLFRGHSLGSSRLA